MADPRVLFGKRVRALRGKRGWSQEKLAEEAELDRTYIGGIERGERNVALLNICRLAKALGVTPANLMSF
jgi:transcriptional regulator with XRE-family HTH domain